MALLHTKKSLSEKNSGKNGSSLSVPQRCFNWAQLSGSPRWLCRVSKSQPNCEVYLGLLSDPGVSTNSTGVAYTCSWAYRHWRDEAVWWSVECERSSHDCCSAQLQAKLGYMEQDHASRILPCASGSQAVSIGTWSQDLAVLCMVQTLLCIDRHHRW